MLANGLKYLSPDGRLMLFVVGLRFQNSSEETKENGTKWSIEMSTTFFSFPEDGLVPEQLVAFCRAVKYVHQLSCQFPVHRRSIT